MKYIVLEGPGGELPVLFPRELMHRWVAERFAPMRVVAAGFVADGPDGPTCHGVSSGLKITSRPDRDTALLREALPEMEEGDGWR
jgi:hypothetical protein